MRIFEFKDDTKQEYINIYIIFVVKGLQVI